MTKHHQIVTIPVAASEIEAHLGRRFRAVRVAHEVTQDEIAKGLGRSINTVRWHEAGARSLRANEIVIAAELIGCAPEDLVSLKPVPKPVPKQKHGKRNAR